MATLHVPLPELPQEWLIDSFAMSDSRARDDARPASDRDVLPDFAKPVLLSSCLVVVDRRQHRPD